MCILKYSSVIFLLYFCSKQLYCKPNSEDSLLQVHTIFRHGERTPDRLSLYPKDPFLNYSFYPFGLGQLTNKGKKTMYILGKKLRKRYGKFVGPFYTPDLIYARSTGFDRTKMSLQLVLAGFFPPVSKTVWYSGIKWQPIPYDYENIFKDKLLYPEMSINLIKQLKISLWKFKHLLEEHSSSLEYISLNSGINVSNSSDLLEVFGIYKLYFGLYTEHEFGLKLPDWTKKVFPQPFKDIAKILYLILSGTDELKRAFCGRFLSKILSDSRSMSLQVEKRKIFFYSAHEMNIGTILNTLGIFKPHIPNYGSCIIFELHKIKGILGFKILYKPSPFEAETLMKIPNCEEFCPLDTFERLFERYLF